MLDVNYYELLLVGFVIGDGKWWLVSCNVDLLIIVLLKKLFEDLVVEKDVFNVKVQLVGLYWLGVDLVGVNFDLFLVFYLFNMSENVNDLGVLVVVYDYYQV